MDELLAAAAEALDAPEAMVERSAQARAKADGVTVEAVLTEWSGGAAATPAAAAPGAAAPAETPAAAAPDPTPEAAPAPAAAADPTDEASLIAAAAVKMKMPESMVKRSAAARAKASGGDAYEILLEWAGVDPSAVPASSPETTAPAAESSEPAPAPAAVPAAPAGGGLDEAALLAAAAEKMGMPESMVKRSAGARAKATGVDVPAVLAEWAGVEAPAASTETPAPAAESSEPAPAPAAVPAAPAGGGLDEAALLAAAAEKMGMPESMVKRSAGARAKATGVDVPAVLAEWAGVEAPAASTETPAPVAAAAPPAAPAAPAAATQAATPATPDVEVLGSPAEVTSEEPAEELDDYESEEEAVAAGALPRWLAALFVIIPAFAIGYALFLPNGPNCGDAGSLAIDPVTGLAVNCDGSEYGVDEVDLFTLGSEIYSGIGCSACHGANGGGVANFPAFTDGALLTTFPQDWCQAQIEWITLGTTGFPEPTYGANAKPVGGSGGVMPGFEGVLTPEEIAAVTLYERVQYGGQDLEAATAECTPAGDGSVMTAMDG